MSELNTKEYLVGIDVGSTTTKIAAVDPDSGEIVYYDYRRHGSAQLDSVCAALERFGDRHPEALIRIAMTGSGAKPVADLLNLDFTQEVVANAIALRRLYKDVGTAVELGGQDAKMLFFRKDDRTGELQVGDMRMNGSCAGGTGAFIDEVASILKTAGAACSRKRTSSRFSTRAPRRRIWRYHHSMPSQSRPSAAWPRAWISGSRWFSRAVPCISIRRWSGCLRSAWNCMRMRSSSLLTLR